MQAVSIVIAYILDLLFGDPRWVPHPVRGIGYLIERGEGPCRRAIKDGRVAGVVFASSIIIFTWAITFALISAAGLVSHYLGMAVSVMVIYMSIAVKDLGVESRAVFTALEAGDLNTARAALSKIVGRDTAHLDEPEIIRATVETVAENIVDGILSPLFYAFLGGGALAMAYKAVSTLDSMIGYKNERYIEFGLAAAKIDDAANFIPARLSVIFLVLASWVSGYNPMKTWNITIRDGEKSPSPNSGFPEAAIAGALDVRLGGLNYYNSTAVQKSYIGDDVNPLNKAHIKEAVKIAYVTSALFVITGAILFWLT